MLIDEEIREIQSCLDMEKEVRVFYIRKDGSRISGVVRNVYPEKKMLSMKPDSPINPTDKHTHPQTFRFKRLSLGRTVPDIYKVQMMALSGFSQKNYDDEHKMIYSCKEGLFAFDDTRLLLEKIAGLTDGFLKGDIGGIDAYKSTYEDIKEFMDKNKVTADVLTKKEGIHAVERYYSLKAGKAKVTITVDKFELNKFMMSIPYTSDWEGHENYTSYHSKPTDWVSVEVNSGGVEVTVYDRAGVKYGVLNMPVGTNGITSVSGDGRFEMLLKDWKWLPKFMRKKECEIQLTGKYAVIDTDSQLKYVSLSKERSV